MGEVDDVLIEFAAVVDAEVEEAVPVFVEAADQFADEVWVFGEVGVEAVVPVDGDEAPVVCVTAVVKFRDGAKVVRIFTECFESVGDLVSHYGVDDVADREFGFFD